MRREASVGGGAAHAALRLVSVLHAIVAFNAVGGGLYGMLGARGVPVAWLEGTVFSSYLVPSLILFFVVGGAHAVASVRTWRTTPDAWWVSSLAGTVLLGWIVVQVVVIGYVSWLQPVMAGMSVVNLGLAGVSRAGGRVS